MSALAIPLDALAQHVVIVGKTGSGKSYAARGMVERLLEARRRVCIVDPTGVFWGLASNAAGDGPGFPVAIFGGDHGHLPLTPDNAAATARVIAENAFAAVLDVSDLSMADRYRWGEAFFRELHLRNRSVLHLIIDEADEFARQQPLPEGRRVLHEVDRIVRRGRVKGFRVMMISQRPAVLHKNVLSQANTLIAMRLPAPQDRRAVEDWISGQADEAQGREMMSSLSGLTRGVGWVWAPEIDLLDRYAFPPIATYDSMRAPDDGEVLGDPAVLAEVDLSALRAALADDTAASATTRPPRATGPDPQVIALEAEVRQIRERLAAAELARRLAFDRLRAIADLMRLPIADEQINGQPQAMSADLKPPNISPPPLNGEVSNQDLPRAVKRLHAAFASVYPRALTLRQAATLAGLSVRSSAFRPTSKALVESDMLVRRGDDLYVSAMPSLVTPRDPKALLEMWSSRFPPATARMLRTIVDAWPQAVERENIAQMSDVSITSSGFQAGLRSLAVNDLIAPAGNGWRASDVFGLHRSRHQPEETFDA